MSLTSYRAAPPRGGMRKGGGERERREREREGLRAWRRPTLPHLEVQYHWRRGFSRPSSGWDRVFGPSLWPPGRQALPRPRAGLWREPRAGMAGGGSRCEEEVSGGAGPRGEGAGAGSGALPLHAGGFAPIDGDG